ncbi:MAG: alanine racemase [Eubacterium sp.]|nr:alanine racemase [Eubacterium sp.]
MHNDDKRYDRCFARIDLNAIRSNILAEKKLIGSDKMLMAVVKADAYGHGAIQIARTLSDFVCGFGVAVVEEALKLRAARIDKMILILGFTGTQWFDEIVRNDISQTVYEYDMAARLDSIASLLGTKAKIHIKVDTGMGRLGFMPNEESIEVIKKISELPNIELEGIFTHFARADEATPDNAREPLKRFLDFVKACNDEGIRFKYTHASNSACIMQLPEAHLSFVRSGISTYGLYPSEEIDHSLLKLKPAMELHSTISFLKKVPAGTPISYGGTYVTERESLIATVPIGYADGMKRSLSNKGRVLVNGHFAPIRGRICMDQFMIDVTDVPGVKERDDVVIFGKSGDKFLPVEEVADLAGSFNYEFVTSLTQRVPRYHVGDQGYY